MDSEKNLNALQHTLFDAMLKKFSSLDIRLLHDLDIDMKCGENTWRARLPAQNTITQEEYFIKRAGKSKIEHDEIMGTITTL